MSDSPAYDVTFSDWVSLDSDFYRRIRRASGVYRLGASFDDNQGVRVVYIGKSVNLRRRLRNYRRGLVPLAPGERAVYLLASRPVKYAIGRLHRRFWFVSWAYCDDPEKVEAELLVHSPVDLLNATRGMADQERALDLADDLVDMALDSTYRTWQEGLLTAPNG